MNGVTLSGTQALVASALVPLFGTLWAIFGTSSLVRCLLDVRVAAPVCLLGLLLTLAADYCTKLFPDPVDAPMLDETKRRWAGDTGDGMWHISGARYDLSDFVKQHPGGSRAILLGRGKECTGLFRSYHCFSDSPAKVLEQFRIDEQGVQPYFTWEQDGFTAAAVSAARKYFDDQGLARTASTSAQALMWLAGVAFILAYGLWLRGWWSSLLPLPILYWLSGSAMLHNGAHFAVSSQPWINDLCAYLGAAHTSPLMWCQQHVVAHHQYPNMESMDPDLHHFRHDSGVLKQELGWRCHRNHKYHEKYGSWRLAIQYVPFFTTWGISMVHDLEFLVSSSLYGAVTLPHMTTSRRARHLLGRFLVLFLGFLNPFACIVLSAVDLEEPRLRELGIGIMKGALFTMLPWFIHGVVYFVFSQVSHVNGECFEGSGQKGIGGDWGTHQVASSWDYSVGNPFVCAAANGLNNQIVHHLFPSVHPCHFSALAPIVAEVAAKHGIDVRRRQSDNFVQALRRLKSWLTELNDAAA